MEAIEFAPRFAIVQRGEDVFEIIDCAHERPIAFCFTRENASHVVNALEDYERAQ